MTTLEQPSRAMPGSQPSRVMPGSQPGGGGPRFSIVVPAYNEAEFLGDCLDSLLGQDYPGPYEIIVVDNNSTDGTAGVARARGVTVVHERRPGVCSARQCGTLLAAGEIVISTDADTVYSRDWLSRIDWAFRDDPARVAVVGPCRFVDAPRWGRAYAWALFHLVALGRRITGRVLYVTATNIAFRKSAWPGYDTQATQGGDELDLLRRLRAAGPVAFDLANPVYTSSRRLYKGLVYNVAVTFFFYYLLGYVVNRLAGRPLVGMAPAFRAQARPARPRWSIRGLVTAGAWLALFTVAGDLTIRLVTWWW
jgi:glycosyltransferase involved in cell wall biosynthesis